MLPASIYATAGRRAHGFGDVLPPTDMYAGLTRAKRADTNMGEPCRGPLFGTAGTTNSKKDGNQRVTELFLSSEVIHPEDNPDRVAHRGLWCTTGEGLLLFRAGANFSADVKRKLRDMAPNERVIDKQWPDVVVHATFEPGVAIETGPATGASAVEDKFFICYILIVQNWQYHLVELSHGATIDEIMEVVGDGLVQPPLTIHPPPPSGLVPSTPSFDAIASDAYFHDGVVRHVGATPGGLVYGETYGMATGEEAFGVPIATPIDGTLRLYVLKERDAVADRVDADYLTVDGTLIISNEIVEIGVAQLKKHGGLLLVPPRAHHIFKAEYPTATRLLELVERGDVVTCIEEPTTAPDAHAMLLRHAGSTGYEQPADIKMLLANECVLQARPEAQRTFADTLIMLRGFSLAKLLAVAGERAIVPRGNRSMAYDMYARLPRAPPACAAALHSAIVFTLQRVPCAGT